MGNIVKFFVAISALLLSSVVMGQQVLDRVAVIVNEGVVLESEVDQLLRQVKANAARSGAELPADKVLRIQAMDRLILTELQKQMAERMGISISDAQLEQTLIRIANEQNMTVDELRASINASGNNWSSYRESIRNEIITGEVQRAAVRRRVYIAPQEVTNLVEAMNQATEQEVEYRLGHILMGFRDNATADEVQETRERAEQLLAKLRDGADFEKAAITSSSGSRALDGGDLGWMNINSMPTLFADAVRGKSQGELIGPLRSGVGFHILKVSEIRGIEQVEISEVKARHILMAPSVILSERRAKEKLEEIRARIIAGEIDFADAAREHSADTGSAANGGELGWAEPSIYAPEFRSTIEQAEIGEISQPFKTQFGWHIAQVLDRRVQDATKRSQENRAYQLLFNRKYQEELENWQQEIRDEAYIETIIN
ncbi:peptidylprolyl isomerase SurA [Pseudidiomarina donghaiensis]|uniref:Chaperone SurA n=1 Tax=Pseudidiomarina donghaiensis TaxID=519452 RepID=A0A432XFU1_9GAMM|nr:peptidylprolyl isomerase SurA [Pseudidiomarina donghaiensis]RUO47427.1 peptidylprolyl isomerase SurA [Pseudidiomarina donghaiensis]SFV23012.1 periplasmic chaperone for outer membrane proteins SurA [Pseudidiomarina donghaiensis]